MNTTKRGFTLIELLIVVAMIAIGAAASLTMLLGPLREEAIATRKSTLAREFNLTWAKLVQDIHEAKSIEYAGDTFILSANEEGATVYTFYPESRIITRVVRRNGIEGNNSTLLNHVEFFQIDETDTPGLLEVHLVASTKALDTPIIFVADHKVALNLSTNSTKESQP